MRISHVSGPIPLPSMPRVSPFSEHLPVRGVHIDWLFEADGIGFTRWTCCEGACAPSAAKQQHHYVIGFLHAGSFAVETPRGSAVADPNSVVLLQPGEPYRTIHPHGCGDRGSALVLSHDLASELLATNAPRAFDRAGVSFPSVGISVAPDLYFLHRVAVARLAGPAGAADALEIEEIGLRAAGHLVRKAGKGASRETPRSARERPSTRESRRARIETVRGLLNERFRERVVLADLGRAVGCSPYHLCRSFRRETGVPLHRYLNRLRLRAAIETAADPGADLTDLALDSGFSSHSHFTAAFRREFSFPPTGLRRLVRGRRGLAELLRGLPREAEAERRARRSALA